ncbi:hypothetical protein PAXINDRAFT_19231 [Paxillus involutus ATCC 200175]|uniref:Uncharacterized protein n=1 Tax=Paxillus involutus ATCC 200175 TaxID=664439 RepID=A0A0C9TI29_PAXIN|nr:hypothetical protein PAXINDRAFT_19231 [Paxillus involutus ATCC 200175]
MRIPYELRAEENLLSNSKPLKTHTSLTEKKLILPSADNQSRSPRSIYNVAIVEETGVGKSFFVNLVVWSDGAPTANNICSLTVGTTCYEWGKDTQTFRLSDSPARQVGASLQTCTGCAAIAAHGTVQGKRHPPPRIWNLQGHKYLPWWKSNPDGPSELAFFGYACITTLTNDYHPEIPGHHDHSCEPVTKYSLLPCHVPSNHLRAVLFGDREVGESSLINFLAAWQIAQLGLTILRLWDAVRLEEPERGTNVYLGAIDNAIQLIQCLNATGGISLLLFYMRGNRATVSTAQRNYTLFHGVLITKEDPIAFAIPHVEKETEMEG